MENLNYLKELKEYLTKIFILIFNNEYEILKEKQKFFNQENINNLFNLLDWKININTLKKLKGDISTQSFIQFYHYLFNNNFSEKEILNIKNDFITKFENNFLSYLNKNLDLNFISKFIFENHYLNIYLNEKNKNEIFNEINNNNNKKEQNQNENFFKFKPIGKLQSCFPEKFSTPRQGKLLNLTRGKIIINKEIQMDSFEGIENFTYIWVIYVFHLHQNFSGSKISPPKLNQHKKLGMFATRTPHRFNPIGLTLCKFEKMEKNEIFISNVDMVDGTPILDIKPYHHLESVNLNDINVKYPLWIKDAEVEKKNDVFFDDKIHENLDEILQNHKLNFYDDKNEILELIEEILKIDPHSKFTKKKKK